MYSEVVAIDYYHNKDFWLPGTAMFAMASYDPYKLKIKKENGADWTYDTPRKFNEEFADVVKELLQRCGLERTK